MQTPALPDDLDLDALVAVAREVASTCGRLVVEERPDQLQVAATKTSAVDIVTEMDRRSEDLAHRLLAQLRPDDAIVGEEGLDRAGSSGVTWLVDPIDGTVNYLYDNGEFAVSVAAVLGDAHTDGGFWPVAGAVCNPSTGELFWAGRGLGAHLDRAGTSRTLAAEPATTLADSLVGTGFAYDAGLRARQGVAVARLLPLVRDIRRHGAASLDLCAVAAGRLDCYYEANLNPWDHAAAWVVVEEAGLVVRGPRGGRPTNQLTMAGRSGILDQIEDVISA
ncbi:MAG: inositol monophosphatase family protein [Propionibacteriaceae bacterium]|nr:inositol monophosphatase family protein [Propionibacteriaceae bacterium]